MSTFSGEVHTVSDALDGSNPAEIVQVQRTPNGGDVLFRPLGQRLFTEVVAILCRTMSLAEAVERVACLPHNLNDPPFVHVIWDPAKKTMVNTGQASSLCKDLMCYILEVDIRRSLADLRKRYGDFLGVAPDEAQLPSVIPAA